VCHNNTVGANVFPCLFALQGWPESEKCSKILNQHLDMAVTHNYQPGYYPPVPAVQSHSNKPSPVSFPITASYASSYGGTESQGISTSNGKARKSPKVRPTLCTSICICFPDAGGLPRLHRDWIRLVFLLHAFIGCQAQTVISYSISSVLYSQLNTTGVG
jgi:hypothetical protein